MTASQRPPVSAEVNDPYRGPWPLTDPFPADPPDSSSMTNKSSKNSWCEHDFFNSGFNCFYSDPADRDYHSTQSTEVVARAPQRKTADSLVCRVVRLLRDTISSGYYRTRAYCVLYTEDSFFLILVSDDTPMLALTECLTYFRFYTHKLWQYPTAATKLLCLPAVETVQLIIYCLRDRFANKELELASAGV